MNYKIKDVYVSKENDIGLFNNIREIYLEGDSIEIKSVMIYGPLPKNDGELTVIFQRNNLFAYSLISQEKGKLTIKDLSEFKFISWKAANTALCNKSKIRTPEQERIVNEWVQEIKKQWFIIK